MIARLLTIVFLAWCALPALTACRDAQRAPSPIVILISIDGFRWDYLDRFAPPALTALASTGVRAEGLIPQFPSKTYPNHYSLATGLRPARHGIVSNNMTSPDIPGRFELRDRVVIADARWWGGEPIWNTAERQGLRASALFWPGSEAPIGGRHATYWLPYDGKLTNEAQVAKTVEWLSLPEGQRPSFLTLYFGEVDNAGHTFGPDSDEVRAAVHRVDAAIAQLVASVRRARLDDRVHYVVVADHGMAALSSERTIVLDDLIAVDSVDVIDWSPVVGLTPRDGNVEATYLALKGRHPALAVYKSAELPARFHLAGHSRLPAIVGIADEGWHITSRNEIRRWGTGDGRAPGGNHGYDPQFRSMHGVLIATGPQLRAGVRVPPIENIHIYELLCALLDINAAPNDGDRAATRGMLR